MCVILVYPELFCTFGWLRNPDLSIFRFFLLDWSVSTENTLLVSYLKDLRAGCQHFRNGVREEWGGQGRDGFNIQYTLFPYNPPAFGMVTLSLTMSWCPLSQTAREPLFYPVQKIKF